MLFQMFQKNIIAFFLLAHNGCISMHQASKTTKHSSCDSRNSTDCFPHFHNAACMKKRHMHVQMCVIPDVSEKCHCILTACAQWMCFNSSSIKNNQVLLTEQQKWCLFLPSFLQCSMHGKQTSTPPDVCCS